MKFKRLKRMADADTIKLSASEDTGIVVLHFKIKGCSISAQYSTDVQGIYAFGIADQDADKLLEMLDAIPVKTVDENDETV
ncbi:unnamed protein product [marine sediment metagenome]|uniref:Uncharacterized protein n=1 Tax=marine sediment metagenome TaxID=412755 RepID=X1A6Q1_9ZZZZ